MYARKTKVNMRATRQRHRNRHGEMDGRLVSAAIFFFFFLFFKHIQTLLITLFNVRSFILEKSKQRARQTFTTTLVRIYIVYTIIHNNIIVYRNRFFTELLVHKCLHAFVQTRQPVLIRCISMCSEIEWCVFVMLKMFETLFKRIFA